MSDESFWTLHRIELLKQRWAQGRTITQIATELDCTRNAIVGKRNRLGLPVRVKLEAVPPVAKPKLSLRGKRVNVPATFRILPGNPAPPTPVPEPEPPKGSGQGASILDLEGCKWIVGDPRHPLEAIFCDRKKVNRFWGGSLCPYCREHAREARKAA